MARYDDEQKKTAFVTSFMLVIVGCALCYWLYLNDWYNLKQSFRLEFVNIDKLIKTTSQPAYLNYKARNAAFICLANTERLGYTIIIGVSASWFLASLPPTLSCWPLE